MKYSKEYKLKCIEQYRRSEWSETPKGIKEKGFRNQVRTWVQLMRIHGEEALEEKKHYRKWNARERNEIVSKVIAGAPLEATAREAGISNGLLHDWLKWYALEHGEGEESLNNIVRQFELVYTHTYDSETGLCRHAWDEARAQKWADPETGRSEHAWGRALGWYMVALADVIELMPTSCAGRERLISIFTSLAGALKKVSVKGVWYQVPDMNDEPGNFAESSASCMITYAFIKGAMIGALPESYAEQAARSFEAIRREFVYTLRSGETIVGKCCQVAGLGGNPFRDGSYAYYMSEAIVSRDPRATGAFIQAACQLAAGGTST